MVGKGGRGFVELELELETTTSAVVDEDGCLVIGALEECCGPCNVTDDLDAEEEEEADVEDDDDDDWVLGSHEV